MSAAYTVKVLGGGLPVGRRIELEVWLVRELERLLGGAQGVAGAYRAALLAAKVADDADRWEATFRGAVQAVREAAELPALDFQVDLLGGHGGAGQ